MAELREFQDILRKFCNERDWEQFHTPKDLTIALMGEVAEVMEYYYWKSHEEIEVYLNNEEIFDEFKNEVADVAIYLIQLANAVDIDLEEAILSKIEKNNKKYPVEKAKGRSDKYTAYE